MCICNKYKYIYVNIYIYISACFDSFLLCLLFTNVLPGKERLVQTFSQILAMIPFVSDLFKTHPPTHPSYSPEAIIKVKQPVPWCIICVQISADGWLLINVGVLLF